LGLAGGLLLLVAAAGLCLFGAMSIVFRGLTAQPIDGVTKAMMGLGIVAFCAAVAVLADHSIGDAIGIGFSVAGIAGAALIATRGSGDPYATIGFPIVLVAWSAMLFVVCVRRAQDRFAISLSDVGAFAGLVVGLVVVSVLLR